MRPGREVVRQPPDPVAQPQLGIVVLQVDEHTGQVPTRQFVTEHAPLWQTLSVQMFVSLHATPSLTGAPA